MEANFGPIVGVVLPVLSLKMFQDYPLLNKKNKGPQVPKQSEALSKLNFVEFQ